MHLTNILPVKTQQQHMTLQHFVQPGLLSSELLFWCSSDISLSPNDLNYNKNNRRIYYYIIQTILYKQIITKVMTQSTKTISFLLFALMHVKISKIDNRKSKASYESKIGIWVILYDQYYSILKLTILIHDRDSNFRDRCTSILNFPEMNQMVKSNIWVIWWWLELKFRFWFALPERTLQNKRNVSSFWCDRTIC